MSELLLSLDGYTDLPPGLIANVVTYFEMRAKPSGLTADPSVTRIAHMSLADYRDLYRRIGQEWLWFSRAVMPDAQLAALLAKPNTEIYVMRRGEVSIGLAELHRAEPESDDVEISMFGVVPEATGTGAGRTLMQSALAVAWQGGTKRVWLHTCTFDHPAAVKFYRRSGFSPFKFAIEVSPDPRVQGFLPREAAPHVALIETAKR